MLTIPSRSIGLLSACLALGVLPLAAQFAQPAYTLSASDCRSEASVCSDYDQTEYEAYTFLLNGTAYAKTFTSCSSGTTWAYSLTSIPDEGFSGPYQLVGWTVNGTKHTGTFSDAPGLVDLMLDADPGGGWKLDFRSKSIRGGELSSVYSSLEILQEPTGISVAVAVTAQSLPENAVFAFPVGSHILRVLDGTTQLEQISVEVTCPTPVGEVRQVNLDIPQSEVICLDLGGLAGPIVPSSVTLAPAPVHSVIALTDNDCFRVSARSVGTDSVTVRYCDAANTCVSQRLAIVARLPKPIVSVTIRDSVAFPSQIKTFCLDTTELPGRVVSVVDLCEEPARTFVEFTYTASTRCVKYRALTPGGIDSTCLVVCDDLGFCDTTKIIVKTTTPQPLPDQNLVFTIDLGTSGSTDLDIEGFATRPTSLEDLCAIESGAMVFFTLDEAALTVGFEGLALGTERSCVLAKAPDGVTQLFNITVNVVTRTPATDTIRIRRGDSQRWCFEAPELVGPVVRLFDDCVAVAPLVTTSTTEVITCLDFSATTVGVQDLCIRVCDSTGRCDLTNLVIVVTEEASPLAPTAVDDAADVPTSGTVTVDVLSNDSSLTPITAVTLVQAPRGGMASFDDNRMLIYVRNPGETCTNDSLVYQICNAGGCAQATVRLMLDCDNGGGPLPPTGRGPIDIARILSPNFDNLNDTWVIKNIEQYPDNEVKIYNRWGARVFIAKGYDNTWDGSFQDGGALPDGTYFYVVEIEGSPAASSYLELRR